MSVRHLMYARLTEDAGVAAVYGTRIIDEGELGETPGAIPEFPFLVTKYGEATPGASRTSTVHVVELWSYGEKRDYTLVDKGLDAVFQCLDGKGGGPGVVVADEPTTFLMGAEWQSTSRGLVDDVLRASVRYATYRVVTNTP